MATAPKSPNLARYNFDLGDTTEAITKDNGRNAAIDKFASDLKTFSSEASQEQSDTLSQAETLKQETVSEAESIKGKSVAAKSAAVDARDEARAAAQDAEGIVYGDALGDLQTILDEINGG